MTAAARPLPRSPLYSRPALQAGLVAIVVGLIAQVWSHQSGAVFAFWDAQAHLDIARRLVDSTTPGLQMLGTVWLPVPHLMMLPFTQVDRWWWNGSAGGIVGLIAFVVTIASLHDLLVRRSGAPRFAWIGTAFVLFNPSLLYLQTTAMTEPVLLAALVASVNALDRWNDSGSRRALLMAAVAAALAVGSRYDGWFYVLVATPTVGWLAWSGRRRALVEARRGSIDPLDNNFEQRNRAGAMKLWWRDMMTFAAPSALMVAAWLMYNWHYFGDPLEFQRGVWSAQSQQAAIAAQSVVPTGGNLPLSIGYYLGATVLCAGAMLTALAAIGMVSFLRHLRHVGPTALLLLTALPFNVLALWARQSLIELPWAHPGGVLNLRYGVMMLPGLAAMVVLGAVLAVRARPTWRRGMFLAGATALVAQGVRFAVHWPTQVGALREGLAIRDGDLRQQHASDWLAQHYDAGRILVDEAVNISPRSRVALRDRVYRWTWQLGTAALAAPEDKVDWVIVDERHRAGVVAQAIDDREAFHNRFDRVFDDGGLAIWRRR